MKYLLLLTTLLTACAPNLDPAKDSYPVTSGFKCTDTTAVCDARFYQTLVDWYGVTAFSFKECSLYPGVCDDRKTFEKTYRGY